MKFLALLLMVGCGSTAIVTGSNEETEQQTTDDGFTPVDDGSSNGSTGGTDNDDSGSSGGGGDTDTDDDVMAFFADCDLDGIGGGVYVLAETIPTTAPSTCASGRYEDVGGDCNDSSASVYPGATESDNDVDDDCDGVVDENVGSGSSTVYFTYYRDSDGDRYGSASSTYTTTSSTMPSGYEDNDDDCDDTDDDVSPAGSEGSTANGIDEDCDGTADDGISSGSGSGSGSGTSTSLVREACVVESKSAFQLGYFDEWAGDLSHWVTEVSSTAYVASPILTGSSGSTGCVSITLSAEGTTVCFNGYGSDSELWGKYLAGALGSGTYAYTSSSYASEVEIKIDATVNGSSDSSAEWATFDGYDLCWTD